MSVGSSFDQWQNDVFFSAAEEVQESADTMESFYRIWIRSRRDGFEEDYDGLLRELQTALGTAKWQLEEFERAVRFSHDSYSSEEKTTITRRRDFVDAIKSQISRIEKDISDSLCEEGKQLRWVQLDEKERDDLAAFLSGVTRNGIQSKDSTFDFQRPSQVISEPDCKGIKENISKDWRCAGDIATKGSYSGKDNGAFMEVEQQNESSITLTSPDTGSWTIDIPDEEDPEKRSAKARSGLQSCEPATSGLERVVGPAMFWSSLHKVKSGEHLRPQQQLSKYLYLNGVRRFVKGMKQLITRSRYRLTSFREDSIPRTRQIVGRVGGIQNRLQGSQHHSLFVRSIRLTLLLVLTIVFVAPFVLYST